MAAGSGSRLRPLTLGVSKHLLPVSNKPMIYYPLATLMLTGIKEVLIVVNPRDLEPYQTLLGDGSQFGISIEYATQDTPGGVAEGIKIGSVFVNDSPFAFILGDNVFHGAGLGSSLADNLHDSHATILTQSVSDPRAYGVVSLNLQGAPHHIEEKPSEPLSKLAITGLYFFDGSAHERVKGLRPSVRGELEIVDLLKSYMRDEKLQVRQLPRGSAWLDMGTISSLRLASDYIEAVEQRQGQLVSSPEEIAWRLGYISNTQLENLAAKLGKCDYGISLMKLLSEG